MKFDVEMAAIRQKCTAAILQVIINYMQRSGCGIHLPSPYLGSYSPAIAVDDLDILAKQFVLDYPGCTLPMCRQTALTAHLYL